MDDPVDYGVSLKRIRRRRGILFAVVLGYVPAIWLVHSLSGTFRAMLTTFLSWVALLLVTCLMAAVCRCPRCGNYFHVHGMTMLFPRRCLHCRLPLDADRGGKPSAPHGT